MKRLLYIISTIVLVLLVGCNKINNIKVESCNIDSFSFKGFRSAELGLSVVVNNPSVQFTLSNIVGEVFMEDKQVATFTSQPITINAKSKSTYNLTSTITVSKDLPIFNLVSKLSSQNFDNFYISLQYNVKFKNGLNKTFKHKKIPVKSLINK